MTPPELPAPSGPVPSDPLVAPHQPIDAPAKGPRLLRFYFKSQKGMQLFSTAMSSLFTGFWLGVLNRKQLLAVGEHYFREERFYSADEYNTRGLFDWEKRAIETHFRECRTLLVAATGGGREVIALRRMGYEADAFEAHPGLLRSANALLEREEMRPDVRPATWDHCPPLDRKYDGIVVGWGAYMHIRGRDRRIQFLKELREAANMGAPVLLSFYVTSEKSRYHRWVGRIGNVAAVLLRRERVDRGDCLLPFYAHFFTRPQVEAEMIAGGFEPVAFELYEYAHSIGRAV